MKNEIRLTNNTTIGTSDDTSILINVFDTAKNIFKDNHVNTSFRVLNSGSIIYRIYTHEKCRAEIYTDPLRGKTVLELYDDNGYTFIKADILSSKQNVLITNFFTDEKGCTTEFHKEVTMDVFVKEFQSIFRRISLYT